MGIPKLIKTDLSVALTGLTADDVKRVLESTTDEPWVKPFIDTILEDFACINYGMAGSEWVTVRDLAVHAHNRFYYFAARCRATSGHAHAFMDQLLSYTASMEGSLPTHFRIRNKDDERSPYTRFEMLGRYNFDRHIDNVGELASQWRSVNWNTQRIYE